MEKAEHCPLCKRPLPERSSRHHLIPRSFGGTKTVLLHRICHRQIHANFTERQLRNYYNNIDRILENENIRKFVAWVKNKPPDFHVKTRQTTGTRSNKRY